MIIYSRCLFLMQSTFQKKFYIHNIKYIVRISNPHSHNKLTSSHRNVSKAPLVAMSHHWHTHTSALHDVSGQTDWLSASLPPLHRPHRHHLSPLPRRRRCKYSITPRAGTTATRLMNNWLQSNCDSNELNSCAKYFIASVFIGWNIYDLIFLPD